MPRSSATEVVLPLTVTRSHDPASCVSVFLENVQETLPRTHALQQLPMDYVDVSEGTLAPVKKFIKHKLLNNFKQGYLDVLSRQQSQFNSQLVLMIQQLTETCALLDHAVNGVHQRLDALETKLEQLVVPLTEASSEPV